MIGDEVLQQRMKNVESNRTFLLGQKAQLESQLEQVNAAISACSGNIQLLAELMDASQQSAAQHEGCCENGAPAPQTKENSA